MPDINSLRDPQPEYAVKPADDDCGFNDAYTLSEEELVGAENGQHPPRLAAEPDWVGDQRNCFAVRGLPADSTRTKLEELKEEFKRYFWEDRLAVEIIQKELCKIRITNGADRPVLVMLLALVLVALLIIIFLLTVNG